MAGRTLALGFRILALPPTSCVTLGKLLHHPLPVSSSPERANEMCKALGTGLAPSMLGGSYAWYARQRTRGRSEDACSWTEGYKLPFSFPCSRKALFLYFIFLTLWCKKGFIAPIPCHLSSSLLRSILSSFSKGWTGRQRGEKPLTQDPRAR